MQMVQAVKHNGHLLATIPTIFLRFCHVKIWCVLSLSVDLINLLFIKSLTSTNGRSIHRSYDQRRRYQEEDPRGWLGNG